MDSVLRLANGGELFQGCDYDAKGAIAAALSPEPVLNQFRVDFLVLAAEEVQPWAPDRLNGLRLPLKDRLFPSKKDERAIRKAALKAAEWCAHAVRGGGRVLSTCAAGLNRSGLVSGLTLRLLGVSGPHAVQLVRRARGEAALSNEDFAQLVERYSGGPLSGFCEACGHEFTHRCGCGGRKIGNACSIDANHAQSGRGAAMECRCGRPAQQRVRLRRVVESR